MGNRICGVVGRRGAVEERLTRPQRLARQPSNVDYKKLRKLILSQKLAPCFDALEDASFDLEECPICFFYYPSLNRSRCCSKGICTECFLQMKPSNATRPAQCPFCKTSCYAVEYRGARTKEEKELELAEEQKFIEAKIRMQSQESQNVEQPMPVNRTCAVSDVESPRPCLEEQSTGHLPGTRDLAVPSMSEHVEVDDSLAPTICNPGFRFEEWDVDLEEIMVMEAIWLSLQDSKLRTSVTPEASRVCSSVPGRGDPEEDQRRPGLSLDRGEASSSDVCPLPRPVEDGDSRLELGPNCDITDSRKPCEDSADESDGTEMAVEECLDNCSLAEIDPSWRPAQLVEDAHVAEAAFATAEGPLADAETRSCFSSYLNSVSSSPGESPTFSNDGVRPGFSQLRGLMVERPMMIVMESNA